MGSGKEPTPHANFVRPIGGQLCPDLPLLEDGNRPTIHLSETLLARVCLNRSNASLKDRCSVAACVGIVCFKKQLSFAQWNAQRVKGMVLVVVRLPNTVTWIRPARAYGIKFTTVLSRWVGRRC
jgi:hypothetical protein